MGVRGYRVIHDKKVIPLRIKLARLHQYTNNKSHNLGKKTMPIPQMCMVLFKLEDGDTMVLN